MKYGLIGERLGHSYSPEIHAHLADYTYELCELAPDAVAYFLQKRAFCAINVTIPYKTAVMPFLDEISPEAVAIGAVNTVVNRGGRLYGYNTDFAGLSELIARTGVELSGKKVLILGTGGTSVTAMAVARAGGAREILRVSRTPKDDTISYEDAVTLHTDAEVLINTTPVGMYPHTEGTPVRLDCFPCLEGVFDAVYHPLRTNLVLDAAARGIPAAGGLAMLVTQAVYAAGHFLGKAPETDKIDTVLGDIEREKQNIVLIGMPSSGKSTVGAILSRRSGKPLLDTDAEIVARIGMPIAAFFEKEGEAAFRAVEREVVAELAKKDGHILATGGGAILDPANVRALKQNGRLVFLDRSLARLTPTEDRPLSTKKEALAALFAARMPLYRAAADITVPGDGTPDEVAAEILKELKI